MSHKPHATRANLRVLHVSVTSILRPSVIFCFVRSVAPDDMQLRRTVMTYEPKLL